MKIEHSTDEIMGEIREYENTCYMQGRPGIYQKTVYRDNKWELICRVTVPGAINLYIRYESKGQLVTEDVFFVPEKTTKGIRFNAVAKGTALTREVARRSESLMSAYQKYLRSLN